MSKTTIMNFDVDEANRTIKVERSFNADVDTVWTAWTDSKILDQWWAPKPWKAETKSQNFVEGGTWLYAMVGPEGEKHWSLCEYQSIKQQKSFAGLDGFCDENGTINEQMPRSKWVVNFTDNGDTTKVNIDITFDELKDLEATIQMGFKEGFTMGMDNLDALLANK